jgi:hypothetical protein
MNNLNKLILLIVLFYSYQSTAQIEEDFESYDTIVGQLSTTKSKAFSNQSDPFDSVLIHAGVGMAMSMTNFKLSGDESRTGLFQGVEVNFGIDLFSDSWMAEGSYRNLGRTEIETQNTIDVAELNEFDLKVVYRPRINKILRFRSSGGLAARYVTYFDSLKNQNLKYNTPAWALSLGMESVLSKVFSFSAEILLRSAMIDETIDNSAIGAALRLDANF